MIRAGLPSTLETLRRKATEPSPKKVSPFPAFPVFFSYEQLMFLGRLWGRGAAFRLFAGLTWLVPRLIGEWDNLEPWGTRLYWWSSGAFASKGALYGNQYLAGRRAPPLPA